MCDCPFAGIFTSHQTHRSWILYKERKTTCNGPHNSVTTSTINTTATSSDTATNSHTTNAVDIDDISVLLDSLDSPWRPATPDMTDPRSVELFEEHKNLAQDYWKMQTELVLLTQKKNELLQIQAEDEQRQRNLKQLKEEKESLRYIRDLLREQRETEKQNRNRDSGDGWVIVPRQDRQMPQ